MVYLNKSQKNFLNKLSKYDSIDCSSLSDEELKIVPYLDSLGFLNADRQMSMGCEFGSSEFKPVYGAYLSVKISEAGKAYFAEARTSRLRFLIPVIISAIALLTSIVSLLMQLSQ